MRLSQHGLRRMLVSDLLDAGANLAVVQKLAGHAGRGTTARYDEAGRSCESLGGGADRVPQWRRARRTGRDCEAHRASGMINVSDKGRTRCQQPPFVVKRILGVGMSHPVVARVLFQFSRILDRNYTTLTEQKSSELKSLLFSLVESMLDAERFKRHYEEKQAEWLKAVVEGTAAELQPHAISFTDPSIELRDNYESFLVKTVITFRRTVTFANASTGRSFKNGKVLLDHLRGAFLGEQNIEKWLDVADTSVKATYDERGNAEHSVTNFRPASVITEDGNLRPIAPTVGDPPELASGIRENLG